MRTSKDRAVVFPNVYQHRVSPFSLVDRLKPGYRKILCFFLVDPLKSDAGLVISTSRVPPQQFPWLEDAVWDLPPSVLDKLLQEIWIKILRHAAPHYMSFSKAKRVREDLMEERKCLHDENKRIVFERVDLLKLSTASANSLPLLQASVLPLRALGSLISRQRGRTALLLRAISSCPARAVNLSPGLRLLSFFGNWLSHLRSRFGSSYVTTQSARPVTALLHRVVGRPRGGGALALSISLFLFFHTLARLLDMASRTLTVSADSPLGRYRIMGLNSGLRASPLQLGVFSHLTVAVRNADASVSCPQAS